MTTRNANVSSYTNREGQYGRPTSSFDPSIRRAAAVIALAAAVVVLLLFLWTVAPVLLLAFAGVLLAVFLHGLARRLGAHTPLSYGWSLAAVVLALVGLLVLAGWLLAPAVAEQVRALQDVIPQSASRLEEQLSQYGWGEFVVDRVPSPKELMSSDGGFWSRATGFLSTAVGMIANVLVILVVGIYLAVNPTSYKRGIARLVPADREQRAGETLEAVGHALWGGSSGNSSR